MLLHLQPSRLVLNTRAYILSSDVLSVQFSPKPLTNRNIASDQSSRQFAAQPPKISRSLCSVLGIKVETTHGLQVQPATPCNKPCETSTLFPGLGKTLGTRLCETWPGLQLEFQPGVFSGRVLPEIKLYLYMYYRVSHREEESNSG